MINITRTQIHFKRGKKPFIIEGRALLCVAEKSIPLSLRKYATDYFDSLPDCAKVVITVPTSGDLSTNKDGSVVFYNPTSFGDYGEASLFDANKHEFAHALIERRQGIYEGVSY